MNKHEQAREELEMFEILITNMHNQSAYKSLEDYIIQAEATEKAYQELQRDVKKHMSEIFIGYDIADAEEDMKDLEGEDLEYAQLLIRLLKVGIEE